MNLPASNIISPFSTVTSAKFEAEGWEILLDMDNLGTQDPFTFFDLWFLFLEDNGGWTVDTDEFLPVNNGGIGGGPDVGFFEGNWDDSSGLLATPKLDAQGRPVLFLPRPSGAAGQVGVFDPSKRWWIQVTAWQKDEDFFGTPGNRVPDELTSPNNFITIFSHWGIQRNATKLTFLTGSSWNVNEGPHTFKIPQWDVEDGLALDALPNPADPTVSPIGDNDCGAQTVSLESDWTVSSGYLNYMSIDSALDTGGAGVDTNTLSGGSGFCGTYGGEGTTLNSAEHVFPDDFYITDKGIFTGVARYRGTWQSGTGDPSCLAFCSILHHWEQDVWSGDFDGVNYGDLVGTLDDFSLDWHTHAPVTAKNFISTVTITGDKVIAIDDNDTPTPREQSGGQSVTLIQLFGPLSPGGDLDMDPWVL